MEKSLSNPVETIPAARKFQFRLRTLLWMMAVVCTSLSVGHSVELHRLAVEQYISYGFLGPYSGIALAAFVLLTHWFIWFSRFELWQYVIAVSVITMMYALLMPTVSGLRGSPSASNYSRNQVMQQALALLNYHDAYGRFPPPYTVDETNNRLHSWRTLLLPYLEELTLHGKLTFDKPWSAQENMKLVEEVELDILRSPRLPSRVESKGVTNYFAIVDEATVWNPTKPVGLADITDDMSKTIVLIEVLNREIPWYEPRDLTMEEAIDVLVGEGEGEAIDPSFFISERVKGDGLKWRIVVFADGHAKSLYPLASREIARSFLTCNGGETFPYDLYGNKPQIVLGYIIHWGRISSIALFVVVALLPFWWKRPSRTADLPQELCNG